GGCLKNGNRASTSREMDFECSTVTLSLSHSRILVGVMDLAHEQDVKIIQ
ncbi:MAG: hypothetical protein JG766_2085, partial [Desulfacinum sp.]|nr:hypothetical protein [Desulfacinum sp.]